MHRSLRARLTIAAALSITVALVVAALSLVALFERHVERRIGAELEGRLNRLAAAVGVEPDGQLVVAPLPPDPRFLEPLSGLYWQIDALNAGAEGIGVLRSRSLWDAVLALPRDGLALGAIHAHQLEGPGNQPLLVRERSIRLDAAGDDRLGERLLRLAVAQDRAEVIEAREAFAHEMLPYLGVIALLLGIATWLQIRTGLAPLETVRQGVNAVRSGQVERLPTSYPEEVKPLALEVNALLDARDAAITQARRWTADLAHGLKTPLSALAADAERLRQQGNPGLADDLEQLAEFMRRRVDRELIRARMRSQQRPHQTQTDVVKALRRLIATLERTPDGARLHWQLEAPEEARVALSEEDLLELLGSLLENAAKWAATRVLIHVQREAVLATGTRDGTWGDIRLSIGDDGPGVPDAQRDQLGQRGLRLDQHKAGSGLGLAIAQDVTAAYGADLDFQRSKLGGLEARLRLPAEANGAARR